MTDHHYNAHAYNGVAAPACIVPEGCGLTMAERNLLEATKEPGPEPCDPDGCPAVTCDSCFKRGHSAHTRGCVNDGR